MRDYDRGDDIWLKDMVTDMTSVTFAESYQSDFYHYWLTTRGDQPLPSAARIDPLALPPRSLSKLMLIGVEQKADDVDFLIRLEGTDVVETVGESNRGRSLDTVPHMRGQIARCQWLVAHRRPYYVSSPLTWSTRDFRHYDALALPFGDPDVTRIVVVFAFR